MVCDKCIYNSYQMTTKHKNYTLVIYISQKKNIYHVCTFAFYDAPTSAPKQVMYYNKYTAENLYIYQYL